MSLPGKAPRTTLPLRIKHYIDKYINVQNERADCFVENRARAHEMAGTKTYPNQLGRLTSVTTHVVSIENALLMIAAHTNIYIIHTQLHRVSAPPQGVQLNLNYTFRAIRHSSV